MCLTPIHSDIRVAKEDIRVFKVLKSGLKAPYRSTQYRLKKLVQVKTRLGGDKSKKDINKGLHACVSLWQAKVLKNRWDNAYIYCAIIPKGAIYKLGCNSDIVSNQLKITRRYAKQ